MERVEKLLELKYEVMMKRIHRLDNICKILYGDTYQNKKNYINIIKEEYARMYHAIKDNKKYEKYKEIEDIIIKKISELEFGIDEYIYKTISDCPKIIIRSMESIKQSENYQNFNKIEEEVRKVRAIKELLKLYSPYLSKDEINELSNRINTFKFDVLLRKQVEQLIYENGGKKASLGEFDNKEEKECFIQLLERKIKSLTPIEEENIENDPILNMPADKIIENNNLLNRLLILDMIKHPNQYTELLNVKLFNPHLCNIGENPYEEIKYASRDLFGKADIERDKVNLSLLYAVLKNLISDENTSIIECEKIYQRFGFPCRPIVQNDVQELIRIMFEQLRGSQEYEQYFKKDGNNNKTEQYCEIKLVGYNYSFSKGKDEEDSIRRILNKYPVEKEEKEENGETLLSNDSIKSNKDNKMPLSKEQEDLENIRRDLRNQYYRDRYEDKYQYANVWTMLPLEDTIEESGGFWSWSFFGDVNCTPVPKWTAHREVRHSFLYGSEYEEYWTGSTVPLWREYQKDFKELGMDIKSYYQVRSGNTKPIFTICLNMDDIADLPIDYTKVKLIPDEEIEEVKKREIEEGR